MIQVSVIGTNINPTVKALREAERVGELLAERKAAVVCGGRGGVMEAVCRGAKKKGGLTIGILPEKTSEGVNAFVDIKIVTGLSWARNQLVALSSDAIIMVGGECGTLSEACVAWMYGKPIVAIKGTGGYADEFAGRPIDGKRKDKIHSVRNAEEAVELAFKLMK